MPAAIITGGSTGIGRALALELAREGYDLGLMARRGPLLEELRRELAQSFPTVKIVCDVCDVADLEACRGGIRRLAQELGRLDLMIANAGIGRQTPAWKDHWTMTRDILQTNVMGAIAGLEAAKAIMLQQGSGHLVGISSVAGFRGLPTSSAYCTSKTALTTYLESLRLDLKRFGITVTSIHPGFIETPMTAINRRSAMPFLLPVDVAARKITRAIRRKKARFIFPWQMAVLIRILRWLPDPVYDFLLGGYRSNRTKNTA